MEQASCGSCTHVTALHRAGRGSCRLNGCPCTGFLAAPVLEPVVADPPAGPIVSVEAFTALVVAIAFAAGFVLGKLL